MFKKTLEFSEVETHTNLSKEQMIAVLDKLKTRADEFEKTAGAKDRLAIAVVNVGFYLDFVTYKPHLSLVEKAEINTEVKASSDGSVYCSKIILTSLGELIGLPEYCAHIAAAPKTHVINLLDHDNAKHALIKKDHLIENANYLDF